MKHETKKLKLYIFDWSGVISDDRKPVYKVSTSILQHYGKPLLSFEEWRATSTMTFLEFCRLYKITEDAAILTELFKKRFERECNFGNKPTHYADAPAVLKSLRNNRKTIAVLSSHPEKFVRDEAQQYCVQQHISHIQGGSHNKAEDLLRILKKLGYARKNALYLGDTIYDIRAAKAAGVVSAGITTGYHTKERLARENPDLLLTRLAELTEL